VVLHVLLEVEVGELLALGNLEKVGELGVRVNLATILGVLEIVGADVGVNLLAHGSASHLGSNLLTKELGKLIADASGLDEARGLAVASRASLLGRGLLSVLELTSNSLLKSLEVVLDGGENTNELLELGTKLGELNGNGCSLSINGGRSLGNSGGNGGGGNRGGISGLHDLLLLNTRSGSLGGRRLDGGGSSSGNRLLIGSLSSSNHFRVLYTTIDVPF